LGIFQREAVWCEALLNRIEPVWEQQKGKPILSETSDGSPRNHGHVSVCLRRVQARPEFRWYRGLYSS